MISLVRKLFLVLFGTAAVISGFSQPAPKLLPLPAPLVLEQAGVRALGQEHIVGCGRITADGNGAIWALSEKRTVIRFDAEKGFVDAFDLKADAIFRDEKNDAYCLTQTIWPQFDLYKLSGGEAPVFVKKMNMSGLEFSDRFLKGLLVAKSGNALSVLKATPGQKQLAVCVFDLATGQSALHPVPLDTQVRSQYDFAADDECLYVIAWTETENRKFSQDLIVIDRASWGVRKRISLDKAGLLNATLVAVSESLVIAACPGELAVYDKTRDPELKSLKKISLKSLGGKDVTSISAGGELAYILDKDARGEYIAVYDVVKKSLIRKLTAAPPAPGTLDGVLALSGGKQEVLLSTATGLHVYGAAGYLRSIDAGRDAVGSPNVIAVNANGSILLTSCATDSTGKIKIIKDGKSAVVTSPYVLYDACPTLDNAFLLRGGGKSGKDTVYLVREQGGRVEQLFQRAEQPNSGNAVTGLSGERILLSSGNSLEVYTRGGKLLEKITFAPSERFADIRDMQYDPARNLVFCVSSSMLYVLDGETLKIRFSVSLLEGVPIRGLAVLDDGTVYLTAFGDYLFRLKNILALVR